MDANQTRYQLVFGRDWRAVRDQQPGAPVAVDGDALILAPRVAPAPVSSRDVAADPGLRRGAVRDRRGNFYIVDGPGIRVCSSPSPDHREGVWFWTGPRGSSLRGLAITADDILVVGQTERPDASTSLLLLFDLWLGGPPRSLRVGSLVVDVAAFGATVWLLGRDHLVRVAVEVPAAVADEGPHGHFMPDLATRADALHARLGEPRLHLDAADEPLALAVLDADTAVVLTASTLMRLRGGAVTSWPLAELLGPAVVGHDIVADGDRVIVADARGNQAFEIDVRADVPAPRSLFLPLHAYRGRDLVVGDGAVWYASGDRWVRLVALPRPRFAGAATAALPIWDSGEIGCVWHRVLIDAELPSTASIRVRSRAADDKDALTNLPWVDEPPLHRRSDGRELPFLPAERGATYEVLLQGAVGRHLQLALELSADQRSTPRLTAVRAYYPRFSYVERYLPAVWREDPTAADFAARFLANPEGIFTAIEDRVAAVHRLLDPDRVDPELLPWLAGWFAVTLDPDWTVAQRRFFVRHAMTLFAWRGTRRGIEAAVRLALAPTPDASVFADAVDGPRVLELFAARPRVGRRPDVPTSPAPATGFVPAAPAAPASPTLPWHPDDGVDLHARWRRWREPDEPALFPPSRPTDPALAAHWDAFCRLHLGFLPGAGEADRARYDAFRARRPGAAPKPKATTNGPVAPIEMQRVPPFPNLPATPAGLRDWYDFEAHVRPIAAAAHRFRLLVPPPGGASGADPAAAARLKARLARVVAAEKPAHTTFDIAFFDHEFVPEEVHLGQDTLLGERRTLEVPALRLDNHALAQAYVGPPFPVFPAGAPDAFAGPVPLEQP